MAISEVTIHLMAKEVPEVGVQKFSGFYTVEIGANTQPGIKFFLYSEQQAVNFKNNLLWAFEKPIIIE